MHRSHAIVGIDQYDVVVDYHAGQSNDPNPGHHDAERHAGDDQTQQNAGGRKDDRRKDDQRLIKAVELGDQNDCHDKQRYAECPRQKHLRFGDFFVLAAETDADPGRQRR